MPPTGRETQRNSKNLFHTLGTHSKAHLGIIYSHPPTRRASLARRAARRPRRPRARLRVSSVVCLFVLERERERERERESETRARSPVVARPERKRVCRFDEPTLQLRRNHSETDGDNHLLKFARSFGPYEKKSAAGRAARTRASRSGSRDSRP